MRLALLSGAIAFAGLSLAAMVHDCAHAYPGDPIPEREVVERAINACGTLRGSVWHAADPFAVLDLFRIERELGAPEGLLVGTFCVEVGMRSRPSSGVLFFGDWRNGVARALGPFQLHENVWSGTCRGTRDAPHDLAFAARCYWAEVLRVRVKAQRRARCGAGDMLRVSEAAAANIRRYGWRCSSRSAHWRMMEAMR